VQKTLAPVFGFFPNRRNGTDRVRNALRSGKERQQERRGVRDEQDLGGSLGNGEREMEMEIWRWREEKGEKGREVRVEVSSARERASEQEREKERERKKEREREKWVALGRVGCHMACHVEVSMWDTSTMSMGEPLSFIYVSTT
jgi:hypothetical protein